MKNTLKILTFTLILPIFLISCKGPDGKFKLPGGDARKFPADPKKRVEQNLKEGRGFRLGNLGGNETGGKFDFASSNELWRATLDTIDFMPLATANYSGGIIVTDWYSEKQDTDESIKISVRFLTNEIRSDALDIKAFNRSCSTNLNCKITEIKGNLISELKKKILKTAAIYQKENKSKTINKNKDYKYPNIK
jgi:hypothetical protein